MRRAICVTFAIIQLIIVSLLLFAAGSTDYYIKREQLFSNAVYAAAGIAITALLCFMLKKGGKRLDTFLQRHLRPVIVLTLLLFFILSLIQCIQGFFFSDWDPAAILYGVYGVVSGHPEEAGTAYFSNHPNNLLLVGIYAAVMCIAGLFGVRSVIALIVFQCVLASLSAFLFWKVMSDALSDRKDIAYAGLMIYEIWVVMSPWFIITYSDEVGIVFPLIMLILRQKIAAVGGYGCAGGTGNNRENGGSGSDSEGVHNGKEKDQMVKAALLWILLSVTAAVGYYIKPQTIIAYIAIVLYFAFDAGMGAIRRRIFFLGTGLLSLVLMMFLTKAVLIPSIGIETDDERSFGMAHYFMMGLNDETDGVYSDEDTLYTDAFETPEEKQRADMKLAADRIKAYGPAGLIAHLKNKTLVNYNDGLFAWGVDGNFFGGRDYEDLGSVPMMSLTELIWSFIRPDGADHGKYSSAQQTIWITVLLLGLIFACFALRDLFIKNTPSGGTAASCGSGMAYIVMLALAGLFVFELLFEAKARYLFIYIPYYLILSVYGTAYLSGGAKWER